MLRMPNELNDYIDYDNGKLIIVGDLPENLKPMYEDFKKEYESLKNNDLTEY